MAEMRVGTPTLRGLSMAIILMALSMALAGESGSGATGIESFVGDGMEVETRFDGDLNGDGLADVVFVERSNDDKRDMVALFGYRSETDVGFDKVGTMTLDPFPLGPASFSFKKGVLAVDDLTGGTTATSSTYRFRFDAAARRMRLIGIDAKLYSRTNNHGWSSISWNLLTGAMVHEKADLIEGKTHEENSYGPAKVRREVRKSKPLFMEDAPSGESFFNLGE